MHDALARHTRRVRVEIRRRHRREHDDAEPRRAEPCVQHDLRDVGRPREDRRAHPDEIHPAAHEPVDHGAHRSRRHGTLRRARIVADERQPRERHRDRELERHGKAHRLPRRRCRHPARAHNRHAQENRQQKQPRHRDRIHRTDAQEADANPKDDERADANAPRGMSRIHDAARRKRPVIDHDRRPAHELEHVEHSKEHPPAPAERHLHRLHRAPPRTRTNHAREEQQETADDVTEHDRRGAVRKPKWSKERPR